MLNSKPHAPITLDGNSLDYVEEFMYLGSLLSKDNACSRDYSIRLGRTQWKFASLQTIWRSKQYSLNTKLQMYNSNVKSVLLYSSECWRVVESNMKRISAFHSGCLWMICCNFWPEKISISVQFMFTPYVQSYFKKPATFLMPFLVHTVLSSLTMRRKLSSCPSDLD